MIKTLPINPNPYFRVYSHHAYMHAIATAENRVVLENGLIADVEITDLKKYNWAIYKENINFKNEEQNLLFYCDKWNQKMNCLFVRDSSDKDEIEITINKQLYTGAYSNIKVFFCDDEDFENSEDLNSIDYGASSGIFAESGIFFCYHNQVHKKLLRNYEFPVKITLIRDGNTILVLYKNNNQKVEQFRYRFEDTFTKIGFSISLGDNKYYEWLFSNYINTYLDISSAIKIDFTGLPQKNYSFHNNNFLMYSQCEKETTIIKQNKTVLEYIKSQLLSNKYVEYEVNDNFNLKRDDSRGTIFHHDLFYGFDDEKEIFYTLYYYHGKIYKGNFPFYALLSERNNNHEQRNIYSFSYSQDSEGYFLDKDYLKLQLKDFLVSQNIVHYDNRLHSAKALFGMACYDYFLDEKNIQLLLSDIRISHFFYERCYVNKDRLDYLKSKKVLSDEVYTFLQKKMELLLKQYLLVRNLILKHNARGKVDLSKILLILSDCRGIELLYAQKLYEAL